MTAHPRAQAILRAQLERAVPIAAMLQPRHPLFITSVDFAQSVHRLLVVSKRVASSSSVLFKVIHSAGSDRLKCSALGGELIRLLYQIVPLLGSSRPTLSLHPRMESLVVAASSGFDWVGAPWQLDASIAANPRRWEAFLGNMVDNLRREAKSRVLGSP